MKNEKYANPWQNSGYAPVPDKTSTILMQQDTFWSNLTENVLNAIIKPYIIELSPTGEYDFFIKF